MKSDAGFGCLIPVLTRSGESSRYKRRRTPWRSITEIARTLAATAGAIKAAWRVRGRKLKEWKIENGVAEKVLASSGQADEQVRLALLRNFEFKLPLAWLLATPASTSPGRTAERKLGAAPIAATSKLRLRFSLWQNRLPVDSLPLEGWIELQVASEGELLFGA